MFTGITYVAVVLVLAYLLREAAKEPHQFTDTVDVYRFPRILVRTILFLSPMWLVALILVYMAKPGEIPTSEKIYTTILFIYLSVFFTVAYAYYKRFYVMVSKDAIQWGGFKIQTLAFRDMGKIQVRRLMNGQRRLSIYRRDGKKVLTVANQLQDFDDLVGMVRSRSYRYKIPCVDR
jgi:hypothetical protein